MDNKLKLSPLGHTWLFDIDGTLVKHNGYKIDGKDTLLEGVAEFFSQIPEGDAVILLTARKQEYATQTERFLQENGIRFNQIIYNLPYGERILINDNKPSGLTSGYCLNSQRDRWCGLTFDVDESL